MALIEINEIHLIDDLSLKSMRFILLMKFIIEINEIHLTDEIYH